MKIFAISDLHLASFVDKPMDIFGDNWKNHWDKIQEDWTHKVSSNDLVLIPGDISWAMSLNEAQADLDSIGRLPGNKILIRGNHDYWWTSISRVRERLSSGMYAIQNDSVSFENISIAGTRGWVPEGNRSNDAQDIRINEREYIRLKLSLDSANRNNRIIVMLHYPPINENGKSTSLLKLMAQYGVTDVVYGHLHGEALKSNFPKEKLGIRLHLVSCDFLDFKVRLI